MVDPPPAEDTSCIGVVGFDLAITVGGATKPGQTLLRAAPVLSLDDCRLPSAVSTSDLESGQPIDVMIDGYDSGGVRRVTGAVHIAGLDDSTSHLALAAVPTASGLPVVVINRGAVFGGLNLSDVQTFTLHTSQRNLLLLSITVTDDIRRWFAAEDPGAFTLSAAIPAGEDLLADVTLGSGGPSRPVRLTPMLDASGLYYTAPLSTKGPVP